MRFGGNFVDVRKRFFDLREKARKRIEKHHGKVIEAHVNLVAHGWPIEADLVGLPERGDFREDQRFVFAGLRIGKWQEVETFEIRSDAAAFEADSMARDLVRARGEKGGAVISRRAPEAGAGG